MTSKGKGAGATGLVVESIESFSKRKDMHFRKIPRRTAFNLSSVQTSVSVVGYALWSAPEEHK